jgi:hypothetical protein
MWLVPFRTVPFRTVPSWLILSCFYPPLPCKHYIPVFWKTLSLYRLFSGIFFYNHCCHFSFHALRTTYRAPTTITGRTGILRSLWRGPIAKSRLCCRCAECFHFKLKPHLFFVFWHLNILSSILFNELSFLCTVVLLPSTIR